MTSFHVPDMTCGSCAQRIARALSQAGLPASVEVEIDVAARQVRVPPAAAADVARQVQAAIEQAGYTPKPVETTAPVPRAGGCCCATRRSPALDKDQPDIGRPAACCG